MVAVEQVITIGKKMGTYGWHHQYGSLPEKRQAKQDLIGSFTDAGLVPPGEFWFDDVLRVVATRGTRPPLDVPQVSALLNIASRQTRLRLAQQLVKDSNIRDSAHWLVPNKRELEAAISSGAGLLAGLEAQVPAISELLVVPSFV